MQEWQHFNLTKMISEIQKSVEKPFECKFLDFASLRKEILVFFCNKLSAWQPSRPHFKFLKIFFSS